jgi:hypothetical protein
MYDRRASRLLAVWVGGWIPTDDSPYMLPNLPPGSAERGVGLSLCPSEVAAAQMTLSFGQSSTQMAQLWVELSVGVAQL